MSRRSNRKASPLMTIAAFVVAFFMVAYSRCSRSEPAGTDSRQVAAAVSATAVDQDIDEQSMRDSTPAQALTTASEDSLLIPTPLRGQILYREGYIVSYNKDLRIPNWVAWKLTPERLTGPARRKDAEFHPDVESEGDEVDTYDYQRSGWDRGHMCPAGDNKFSRLAMDQSFLMSNICPQDPNLNRGDWNEMEIRCRQWAEQYGSIYIVCGPVLYKGRHQTIGRHRVTVPEAFFKCVLCLSAKKPWAVGFVYHNIAGNHPKSYYVNSVNQVERITGYNFFPTLRRDIQDAVEQEHQLP